MPTPKKGEHLNWPNTSFRYHFHYRLLDGDERGQPGKLKEGTRNPTFNQNYSKSCLQLLAEHSENDVCKSIV